MLIKTERLPETINRLERFVNRFERRYEVSTPEMIKAVHEGRRKETAEIGEWLSKYRVLDELRGYAVASGAGPLPDLPTHP